MRMGEDLRAALMAAGSTPWQGGRCFRGATWLGGCAFDWLAFLSSLCTDPGWPYPTTCKGLTGWLCVEQAPVPHVVRWQEWDPEGKCDGCEECDDDGCTCPHGGEW